MTHSVSNTNHSSASQFIYLGALRSIAGFPFEHPLELMKVTAQAAPMLSNRQVLASIVKERGILGFTNTVLTNFPQRVLRESVRWPVINYMHEQLITRFPKTLTKEGTGSKVLTGLSVVTFDSLVILSIEQLIAYRVKEKARYTAFFHSRFSQEGISSLYRGIQVNFLRQSVVWTSVMGINHEAKRKFDELDQEKAHPYLRQAVTSTLVAGGLITWGMPIDFVKTRIQMDVHLQKKKISSVVKSLRLQYGFKGFYAGSLPVFVHTVFHATLGGFILDRIFASHKSV